MLRLSTALSNRLDNRLGQCPNLHVDCDVKVYINSSTCMYNFVHISSKYAVMPKN